MHTLRPDCEALTGACLLTAADVAVRLIPSTSDIKVGVLTSLIGVPFFLYLIVRERRRLGADLLLTPSHDADENLKREGVAKHRIQMVGNIMIDALIANVDQARKKNTPESLGMKSRPFVYVTLHRPSNVDDRESLGIILNELERLSKDFAVVFPVHPRTRKMISEFGLNLNGNDSFRIIEPIGYHDSLCLTERARFVLTDSGGLQEETTYLGVPCFTLRDNTERPVTVTLGSNRLTNPQRLRSDIGEVLNNGDRLGEIPPFWDGKTAERTLDALAAASVN